MASKRKIKKWKAQKQFKDLAYYFEKLRGKKGDCEILFSEFKPNREDLNFLKTSMFSLFIAVIPIYISTMLDGYSNLSNKVQSGEITLHAQFIGSLITFALMLIAIIILSVQIARMVKNASVQLNITIKVKNKDFAYHLFSDNNDDTNYFSVFDFIESPFPEIVTLQYKHFLSKKEAQRFLQCFPEYKISSKVK